MPDDDQTVFVTLCGGPRAGEEIRVRLDRLKSGSPVLFEEPPLVRDLLSLRSDAVSRPDSSRRTVHKYSPYQNFVPDGTTYFVLVWDELFRRTT